MIKYQILQQNLTIALRCDCVMLKPHVSRFSPKVDFQPLCNSTASGAVTPCSKVIHRNCIRMPEGEGHIGGKTNHIEGTGNARKRI